MKTFGILPLLAAGALAFDVSPLSFGAFSEPVEARALESRQAPSEGQVVLNALYEIGNQTQALNTQIDDFTVLTLTDLNTASLGVVATIIQAVANVSALTGMLTDQEVIPLIYFIEDLGVTINGTIDNLISRYPDFGGATFVVVQQLQFQYSGTVNLTAAIAKLLPSALLSSAATLSLPILANLTRGIDVFNVTIVNPPETYIYSAAPRIGTSLLAVGMAALVAAASLL